MKRILCAAMLIVSCMTLSAEPGDDKRIIYSLPFAQNEGEYMLRGKDSDIYKLIKRLEADKERSAEDSIDLGYAYFIIGDKDKAVKEFERAIKAGNVDPKCNNMIGGIYLEKGNRARAEEYYTKTLAKYPDNATALYNMAEILFKKGDTAGAGKNIELILESDKEYYDAHQLLGLIAQKEGRDADAEKLFRREIELYESSPESHRRLADLIAKRNGDIDEVIHHYRTALNNSPYDNEVRKLLISAYEKKGGDYADIARKEKKLLTLRKQSPVLYNYAMTFVRKDSTEEDYRNAIEILNEQLKRNPGYLSANLNIGVLHARLGDTDKAFDYYLKEFGLNPNSASACYNIAFHFINRLEQSKTRQEQASNISIAKGMFHLCTLIDPLDKTAAEYEAKIDRYISGK